MKIKGSDILKLSETLKEIYNNSGGLNCDNIFIDISGIFSNLNKEPIKPLPDKFKVKIISSNIYQVNRFIQKYCTNYKGYATTWNCDNSIRNTPVYLAYPQSCSGGWILDPTKKDGYKEITIEELEKHFKLE